MGQSDQAEPECNHEMTVQAVRDATERRDQAEQDRRAKEDASQGDTQPIRQSPTITGAVARYDISPVVNLFEMTLTIKSLGTDKGEGQADQRMERDAEREGQDAADDAQGVERKGQDGKDGRAADAQVEERKGQAGKDAQGGERKVQAGKDDAGDAERTGQAADDAHGDARDGQAEPLQRGAGKVDLNKERDTEKEGRDDDARDAERKGQAADDAHGDAQDGQAEPLRARALRRGAGQAARGRAEQCGRAVNTQTARQSPTTPGAVARYCTNPLINMYDNVVTNSNLGSRDKPVPEHELCGQAEQEIKSQRGREAEQGAGQEQGDQAEQVGRARRGAEGGGQAEHITCRAEPPIGRAEHRRKVETIKKLKWREFTRDESGIMKMVEVVDRGLMVSTNKGKRRGRRKKVEKTKPREDKNNDRNGENTLGLNDMVKNLNLKLKLCLTPRLREDCLEENRIVRMLNMEKTSLNKDKKISIASLEERRLVQFGRKIFEKDGQKEKKSEEEGIEEKRKIFREEKIKIFEKKVVTPRRRKRKEDGERKMTPISLKKIEKSSQTKKVYGAREREKRKISESLRLGGAASTCRKIDSSEIKRKLEMTEGTDKKAYGGTSPPRNWFREIKTFTNPLGVQGWDENLDECEFERKDVIGSMSRERGACTNRERCNGEQGQAIGLGAVGAGKLSQSLKHPYE